MTAATRSRTTTRRCSRVSRRDEQEPDRAGAHGWRAAAGFRAPPPTARRLRRFANLPWIWNLPRERCRAADELPPRKLSLGRVLEPTTRQLQAQREPRRGRCQPRRVLLDAPWRCCFSGGGGSWFYSAPGSGWQPAAAGRAACPRSGCCCSAQRRRERCRRSWRSSGGGWRARRHQTPACTWTWR